MYDFSVSQVSISAPVCVFAAAAAAEEWLFLERFEELFIDLCQSTKRGAVAAAPLSLSASLRHSWFCLLGLITPASLSH